MKVSARPCLLLGIAVLIALAALAGPLERLADSSFAWHMLQHLALLYVVAPLILIARPFEIYASLAGKRATATFVRVTRTLHALTLPPIALLLFVATLWGTHFSRIYELSLDHQAIHVGEHALYLVAGLLFWIPVLGPPPVRPLSYPARLLYLLVALPQGALLAMVIASAREPLYAHYVVTAGSRAAALADQANAAAVMWIVGGFAVFAALLFTVGAWAYREHEVSPT